MREPIRSVLSGAGPGAVVVGSGAVVVGPGAVVVGVVDGQPAITITTAINNAVRIKTVFFKYLPPLFGTSPATLSHYANNHLPSCFLCLSYGSIFTVVYQKSWYFPDSILSHGSSLGIRIVCFYRFVNIPPCVFWIAWKNPDVSAGF